MNNAVELKKVTHLPLNENNNENLNELNANFVEQFH